MPDEDPEAGEPDEAHEVTGFGLVAGVDAAVAQEPSDKSLHVPPSAIATKGPAVLGLWVAWVVRGDELYATSAKLSVERVAVVGLVADQEPRERFREAGVDCLDDELLLMSRTTRNPCGDRKTRAV
jgi:hypothetical protein